MLASTKQAVHCLYGPCIDLHRLVAPPENQDLPLGLGAWVTDLRQEALDALEAFCKKYRSRISSTLPVLDLGHVPEVVLTILGKCEIKIVLQGDFRDEPEPGPANMIEEPFPNDGSVDQVCLYFERLGASAVHLERLRAEAIDGEALRDLTEDDLRRDLMLPLGVVRKHLNRKKK